MSRTTFSFKYVLLAGALASTVGLAQAQTPAATPQAGETAAPQVQKHRHARADDVRHKRLDPAQRAARHEQRVARLKQDLGITAEQEPAWHAFTASMLPTQRPAPTDRAEIAKLTTPQRIERMRAMQQARTDAMNQRADAVLRLYGALTPEQQQKFDQRHAHAGAGHHGPRHHRGMPPRPEQRG